MNAKKIISLGYERRSVDELLEILYMHKVTKLLDVREVPISRKKGFSKKSLTLSLMQVGIKYKHIKAAGNPHRKENDLGHGMQLYSSYLHKNPEVIEQVLDEISDSGVAVFCYERSHLDCHRSVLLDSLVKTNNHINIIRVE